MPARSGETSVDGTLVSATDRARIEAEEQLHAAQRRSAVRVVAAAAVDAEDRGMLLAMLGLGGETITVAPAADQGPVTRPRRPRAA